MKTTDPPDIVVGMSSKSWSVNYLRLLANNEVEPKEEILNYVADFLSALIDQTVYLELENCKVKSRLAQVERERDAAVADINRCCGTCKHFQNEEDDCTAEECIGSGSHMEPSGWQWRGICPENSK